MFFILFPCALWSRFFCLLCASTGLWCKRTPSRCVVENVKWGLWDLGRCLVFLVALNIWILWILMGKVLSSGQAECHSFKAFISQTHSEDTTGSPVLMFGHELEFITQTSSSLVFLFYSQWQNKVPFWHDDDFCELMSWILRECFAIRWSHGAFCIPL